MQVERGLSGLSGGRVSNAWERALFFGIALGNWE